MKKKTPKNSGESEQIRKSSKKATKLRKTGVKVPKIAGNKKTGMKIEEKQQKLATKIGK